MINRYVTSKVDKRKKYILVFDCETACGLKNPVIYDKGWTIIDKQGNIYEKRSYVIEEIFNDEAFMETAYYKKKIPMYWEKIKAGEMLMKPWAYARAVLMNDIEHYGVAQFSAYNLGFDLRALENTAKELPTRGYWSYFNPKVKAKLEFVDIWTLACQTILQQKTFHSLALENGWFNKKTGNHKTNAEVAFRYITSDHNFKEEHTALSDCIIESAILAKCYRQKKKIVSKFHKQPFTFVTQKHGKIQLAV